MSNSDRKRRLEELVAKRKAEAAEASEEKKQQKKTNSSSGSAGSPKEKKSPSVRSSPVRNKTSSPLKPRGGRATTLDKYVDDGFIDDDDDEDVLDSESQPSSGENFTVSDETGSDYSDNVGSSKKKKVTLSTKKPKGGNNKKKTTKRKKIESDDDDSSEEEIVKKKPSKKNKKKKANSDGSDEDLSDIRKDELDALDTNQIIRGRRTRGKKIDFTGQDPYDDYE